MWAKVGLSEELPTLSEILMNAKILGARRDLEEKVAANGHNYEDGEVFVGPFQVREDGALESCAVWMKRPAIDGEWLIGPAG